MFSKPQCAARTVPPLRKEDIMKQAIICVLISICTAAAVAACPNARQTCKRGGAKNAPGRVGGCCGRQVWDTPSPRPELNPPDDIASLPEREQLRFVKMFRLVPEQIKVKSVQSYNSRMAFMASCQYRSLMEKLAVKLNRSGKMLAKEPAVTADEVKTMCRDTIVYGRSLIMGRMDECSFADLARRYGFSRAQKAVESVEDSKNFKRGLARGYPLDEPENKDFATLAHTVNKWRWEAFMARVKELDRRHADRQAGVELACGKPVAKAFYDNYEDVNRSGLPEDMQSLPNCQRAKIAKIYDLLPVQVVAYAGRDYAQRATYFVSGRYADVKRRLAQRLEKDKRRLSADPAVSVDEVLKACDEIVRFGRPLVFGDMRNVSLGELARAYNYSNVGKFVEKVEDAKYLACGKPLAYASTSSEFRDFAQMARAACPERWKAFLARLGAAGRVARR